MLQNNECAFVSGEDGGIDKALNYIGRRGLFVRKEDIEILLTPP
jgi:hypothetical protein